MAAESRVMSQSSQSSKSAATSTSEMLIELVRNHPVLYDKRHLKHKDNVLKDDLWHKIGREWQLNLCMHVSIKNEIFAGMAAQNKFKNLKDTFQKHRNKIKDSMRSGAGAADVPTHMHKH
ncbi:uncharacterized protein LOC142563470 [Dermacentor variabilis]|uniref:uncharacterized protein LOC142563470 n=1 Tax=Dermacentor variabilis TaxID=34621 RepID=UPI003F5B9883